MKLVRDKIPQIMKNKGLTPRTHIANKDEFLEHLIKKLQEEVKEFTKDPSHEELADVLEVIDAIHTNKFKKSKVLAVKKKKRLERGAFKKRIILE
ncbi:MAG TPA: nucleoside triphosphate pyrophosphohydrolase [Acidobacteriota bacterium]|nr:nucleoside triphosphate pyrophosphohydrolase [Acidobacteriota bacterium]